MRERYNEELELLREDLEKNRLIKKVSGLIGLSSFVGFIIEANVFGPKLEDWELVVFGATAVSMFVATGLAGLGKMGEGTFQNAIRYRRHELSRLNVPHYHPRSVDYTIEPPSNN